MFLMLFTAKDVENSLKVVICFSMSWVERPVYVQTTLTTGMSMLGKMSLGVSRIVRAPRTRTRSDMTTKV